MCRHRFACTAGPLAFASFLLWSPALAQYQVRNLVADVAGVAEQTDANLVNPWGIAFNPAGFSWIANNHTGTSTLYDGNGIANSLVVNIPTTSSATGGSPTGIVYNGGSDFVVQGNTASGPSRFLFASEAGTISGWNPSAASTSSIIRVDSSTHSAIYKGLALSNSGPSRLYSTDFHNGHIDTFDGSFGAVTASFTDPNLPAGYAPFGIRTRGDRVYVTYALQDANGEDDVPGAGHGFIDVYNTDGVFTQRLASGGVLNSPWGMAFAPADFGALSNALLVGNFGDGHINAFDPTTGAFLGALTDANGVITIEGLWALEFGNGILNQPANSLFFTAGPSDEEHGLYGRINVPAPGTLPLALISALMTRRRRR